MDMAVVFSIKMKTLIKLKKKIIDNRLSIHFGEYKTKSILFSKARGLMEMKISFAGHSFKQHETVEYLGCQLDFKLSGEAMALKVLKKINVKLKFLPGGPKKNGPKFQIFIFHEP